ncbi:DUF885 domain-containing protein [Akkermansiaceae bacterium]|nr:DUF885 domain-containing protein [Akkermansiaceae bacterium]MDA7888504.1 DUF885 domain-containing protein [Akkermansiaceae bacterium]
MKRFSSLFLAVLGVAGALSWTILGKAQEKAETERSGSVVELIEGYETDRDELDRFYGHRVLSQSHMERLEKFYDETTGSLKAIDFEKLPQAERVDYLLMRHRLEYRKSSLATNQRKLAEIEKLTGFKRDVLALYEEYRQRGPMEPRAMAEKLVQIKNAVSTLEDKVSLKAGEGKLVTTAVLALRTQKVVGELQRRLEAWYKFYAGFDPQFSWWVKQPYGDLKNELESYRKKLGELATGGEEGEEAPLVGDPIGAAALADDLAMEMLSYSPEDLLAIGEREFAWCRAEMEKAAAEMGLGKDWRKALERVKEDFVPPGKQDDLSAEIAKEAMAFLEERNLVTVPDLCAETWYLKMLGKREQETLPYAVYFGQAIGIAYPTDEMSLEKKLMSLRGNNRHFTRAVIPHELIPGHHLQKFMAKRHATHRGIFSTPFYVEGWALHWEMLLYDLNYPRTPEERIGMLFWRSHRCARIIVSLKFHLGRMSPDEMVAFLVNEVGLEESGARSEVRRYIGDSYSPLYQCGYMLGGLQLRALYKQIVGKDKMSPREFHDTVLKMGPIPIEMVRATLLKTPLTPDYKASWDF